MNEFFFGFFFSNSCCYCSFVQNFNNRQLFHFFHWRRKKKWKICRHYTFLFTKKITITHLHWMINWYKFTGGGGMEKKVHIYDLFGLFFWANSDLYTIIYMITKNCTCVTHSTIYTSSSLPWWPLDLHNTHTHTHTQAQILHKFTHIYYQ